jgi:hypothetical protein
LSETLLQLIFILNTCREARDENSIQHPKSILWAMRKCQMYHEGKIRLLHKLTGMEFLNREYASVFTRPDWYKGYHVFEKKSEVKVRFRSGEPLSCFCLDGDCNEVHVAFTRGEPEQEEMNTKSLSYRFAITHHKCTLMRQECSSVDLSVLMRFHRLEKPARMYWIMHSCYPIQRVVFHSKGSLLWCILIERFFCVITVILITIRDLSQCICLCLQIYSLREILYL